jgi:Protein of unknown function (DUF2569)
MAVEMAKSVIPGIRGGLIAVLVFLMFRTCASAAGLFISLFGFDSDPGFIFIYREGLFESFTSIQQASLISYVIINLVLLALDIAVLRAFLRKKKYMLILFTSSIVVGTMLVLGWATLSYFAFGDVSAPVGMGIGVALAIGIIQYLLRSDQVRITFVN